MKYTKHSKITRTSKPASASMLFTIFLLFIVTATIATYSLITYTRVHNRLRTIAVTESEQALSLSSDIISTSFNNIWEVFTDSRIVSSFTDIIADELIDNQLPHGCLLSLSEVLRNHFYAYEYVQDVGLFINTAENDYWCTTKIISDNFRRDYENGLYSFDDLSYDLFRDMILNSVDNRIVYQDFYAGYVNSGYSPSYSGQIIYLIYPVRTIQADLQVFAIMQINLDNIRETLTSFQYCGSSFSLYANDLPVYSTELTAGLPFADYRAYFESSNNPLYIKSTISALGLTCYTSLDSDKIYEGIAPFSQLLVILFSIVFSTFALFILFLYRYWLIPIIKTAATLPSVNRKEKPIEKINRHLVELKSYSSAIQNELLNYQKNLLLKELYLGHVLPSESEAMISELEAVREANYRCIYVARITAAEPQRISLEYIMDQIKNFSMTTAAHAVIDDVVTCLVIQDDHNIYADSRPFFDLLNGLLSHLNDDNSQFAIGISDVYNSIDSIPYAYHQAGNSWQSALVWQNSAVVFNTALVQAPRHYLVNYTQLESMYQAIISNRRDTALEIFDKMVAENFSDKDNQQRALYHQQFLDDIMGVLIRISTEYDIHAIIESYLSLNQKTGFPKKVDLLRKAIIESCEFIPLHDYDSELINAIMAYCEKHYSDYQLSLSLLSDQFHLSKSSISKYFKANSGVNFSTYIERLRLAEAKKLIWDNTMPIKEIAATVGYQNITTFYNAFRKVENCTPTEWRQNRAISEETKKKNHA